MALDERHVVGVSSADAVRIIKTASHGTSRIAAYEGMIMPVADISSPAPHGASSTSVLILQLHRRHVALVVDSVSETLKLASGKILISPEAGMNERNCIHGHFVLQSSVIVVLDVERFFAPLLKA